MIVFKVKVFPDLRILITPICGEPMVMAVVWLLWRRRQNWVRAGPS